MFKEVNKHIVQTTQTLTYFRNAEDIEATFLKSKFLNLPAIRRGVKKTIVFDLDETLIHCDSDMTMKYDLTVEMTFPSGNTAEAGVNIRPGAI